jgi:hypothetical protein
MQSYITATGAYEQIPSPLKSIVPLDMIVADTCRVMNELTGMVWASGDSQMMRATEKIAAVVALKSTYRTCMAVETLLEQASNLVTLLKLTPSWRDL